MTKLPVDDPEFWNARLKRTMDNKYSLHVSVYDMPDVVWANIQDVHRIVLRSLCTSRIRLLDAGCGLGHLCEVLPSNRVIVYTGIDHSPAFIAKAKELHPERYFEVGNLNSLAYDDGYFDLTIGRSIEFMIHHIGEASWGKIERELLRVSKVVVLLSYEEPELVRYLIKPRY